jgi:stalled ribosome rescue protein Dom34
METKKNIGIWMDHSNAHFVDSASGENNFSIASEFTTEVKEEALSRNENLMHNKEQNLHEAYYNKIASEILNYDHVLLFGPTNAKTELYNYIKTDAKFMDVKIDKESADYMTDNEKRAFVLNHFQE